MLVDRTASGKPFPDLPYTLGNSQWRKITPFLLT
jgi:hypothetical protein